LLQKGGAVVGTTFEGGFEGNGCKQNYPGCGVVFSVSPAGVETVLYSFQGEAQDDGDNPEASLITDTSGDLLGTTSGGGVGRRGGNGTVFALGTDGQEKVLYRFLGGKADGLGPVAGLVADASGNMYGTTLGGGVDRRNGTVFEVSPTGNETILYAFKGGTDGQEPLAGLVLDKSGNLFGTTFWGGGAECGTMFKIAPDGTETIVHAFGGGADGCNPEGTLSADAKGDLYGTTVNGGGSGCESNGCGTVFELSSKGFKSYYAFKDGKDGATPHAGVVADKDSIYGTTFAGGGTGCNGYGCGVAFEIDGKGETVLHAFSEESDGAEPAGSLVLDRTGHLFGTTTEGGAGGAGTVFEVDK
jgi:uncharacterized repeat protein (TIGR03803 family)